MRCPKCSHIEDKVIDSRTIKNGAAIRRRRVCLACAHRFTTYEEVVKAALRVVKRDGRSEDFERQKLAGGIFRACEKRPISAQDIDVIVDDIVAGLERDFEREIPTTVIGKKVMERLEKVDEVAYVRFASVYRRFRDVSQFLSEVESLIGRE